MRRLFPLPALLACLLVSAGGAVAHAQDWKDQKFADCRCSASFPGSPQTKSQKMQSNVGALDQTIIMHSTQGSGFYAVAYFDYPREHVAKNKAEAILDATRDNVVKNVKGQLTSETKTSMNGFEGRVLRIEAPGDLVFQARFFLVKERLYQVLAATPKAREGAPEIKRFLDSFKFDRPQ